MPQQQSDIRERTKYKKPRLYKVIMFNDEYTTMEFVVRVLEKVFHKSHEEAKRLMIDVHNKGQATVGIYSYDMARSKVEQTSLMAREQGYPLRLAFIPE